MLGRLDALLEGKSAVPVDFVLKTFLAYRLYDNIDPAAKPRRQTLFKLLQLPEIIEPARREILRQLHDHIDIGIDARVITRD